MEAFITEAHHAEAIRKTKRRDAFLDHIQVFTLRDSVTQLPRGCDEQPALRLGPRDGWSNSAPPVALT